MTTSNQFRHHSSLNGGLPDASTIMAELQRERSRRIQIEQENGLLRKQLAGRDRTSKIVQRAVRDASELLLRKTTGFAISREVMMGEGMSFRQWTWAVALLRYCQIINPRGKRFTFKWFTHDVNELFEMFEEGTSRLMAAPKPLESLRQYLPESIKR